METKRILIRSAQPIFSFTSSTPQNYVFQCRESCYSRRGRIPRRRSVSAYYVLENIISYTFEVSKTNRVPVEVRWVFEAKDLSRFGAHTKMSYRSKQVVNELLVGQCATVCSPSETGVDATCVGVTKIVRIDQKIKWMSGYRYRKVIQYYRDNFITAVDSTVVQ